MAVSVPGKPAIASESVVTVLYAADQCQLLESDLSSDLPRAIAGHDESLGRGLSWIDSHDVVWSSKLLDMIFGYRAEEDGFVERALNEERERPVKA